MTEMPAVQTFQFQWHEVRVIDKNGAPWFVEVDIKRALGMDYRYKVAKLLEVEKGKYQVRTPGGVQMVNVVSESGLYKLIMRSEKAEAEPFQNWVTQEVLPAIRQTGHYEMTPPVARVEPTGLAEVTTQELAFRWLDVEMKIDALFEIPKICSFQEAVKKIKAVTGVDLSSRLALTPHAEALPAVDEFLEIAELTLRYELPRGALNRWLEASQYQRRWDDGSYEPTERAMREGVAYRHAWTRGTKSGVNLKWRVRFIDGLVPRVREEV